MPLPLVGETKKRRSKQSRAGNKVKKMQQRKKSGKKKKRALEKTQSFQYCTRGLFTNVPSNSSRREVLALEFFFFFFVHQL